MAQYEITSEEMPLDFECTMVSNMTERTIRNAKNLLMCRKGEIPFDQLRGIDSGLFDIPLPQAQGLITAELDRVMLWEPDVEVVEGWLEQDENGETIVHCIVDVSFEQ